jgi:hypothetical protein
MKAIWNTGMKSVLIAAILLGMVQLVLAESQAQLVSAQTGVKNLRKFLCVTDPTAAGIEYKASQQAWMPTIFTAGDKYIVSIDVRNKDRKTVTTVMPYGDVVPYWFCGATVVSGALLCSGKSSLFVFNERTLRFIDSFFDGYVDGVDDGLNKPYIVVGTCSRL